MRNNDTNFVDEERPINVEMTIDEDVSAVVWNPDDEESAKTSTGDESAEMAVDDPDTPSATQTAGDSESRSAWRHFVQEEMPQISLREILGGDYLVHNTLRNNIGFIVFLAVLGVAYITNRYLAQQEIIEVENLHKELEKQKNFTLTQSALLTMHSRQSYIEQRLLEEGETLLGTSNEPPFIIRSEE